LLPEAWPEILSKSFLYLSVAVAIGVAVTRRLISKLEGRQDLSGEFSACGVLLSRLALAAGTGVLAASVGRAIGHTITSFGLGEFGWEAFRLIAFESRWGQSWQFLMLAASALALAAVSIRIHQQAGWRLFAALAVIVVFTLPLLGHAAGSAFRFFLHVSHTIAVSSWLGSLAVIVVLRSRVSRIAEILLRDFSRIALPAAAVTVAAGAAAAVIYLQSLDNLWNSAYGRRLLLKLSAFAGILICGTFNWRRASSGQSSQLPLLQLELSCAAIVIALTSVLTETEHP
jgi:copper transport protein